jgi:folate-binding protein YgfZ
VAVDFLASTCEDDTMHEVTPAEAARAARQSVLVVPMLDRTTILVTGRDRSSWLNGLVTCDLAKRQVGNAAYGLLVEKKGKIQADLFVVPSADESVFALVIPSSQNESGELFATLDHYLIMEDVELALVDAAFFMAHGPAASELAGIFPYSGRVDLLGQGGVVFGAPRSELDALLPALHAAVAKCAGCVVNDAVWNQVRIEHGLPRFGVEFDGTCYPQEASLETLAVSFSKGCYLGQEVVYMLQERGHVKRKLVSLECDDATHVPASGAAISTPAGEVVGEIKSAVVGPWSGKTTALAMVKWAHTSPGTELRVDGFSASVRRPLQ